MNTQITTQEKISAFADGVVPDDMANEVLAALKQKAGRDAWDRYHQIGDALRSGDLGFSMSPGFAVRMAERLENEDAHCLKIPKPSPEVGQEAFFIAGVRHSSLSEGFSIRRFLLPVIAAVSAVTAVSIIAVPQIFASGKNVQPSLAEAPSASDLLEKQGRLASANAQLFSAASTAAVPLSAGFNFMLDEKGTGDAAITPYLFAHQGTAGGIFTPVKYVRSGIFTSTAEKK